MGLHSLSSPLQRFPHHHRKVTDGTGCVQERVEIDECAPGDVDDRMRVYPGAKLYNENRRWMREFYVISFILYD